MKTVHVIVVLLMMSCMINISDAGKKMQKRIKKLQAKVNELESEIDSLEKDVKNQGAELKNLQEHGSNDECQNYKNLTSASRNVKYGKSGIECDATVVPGWFRFQGEAGTKMATTCPPHLACDTSANGWLKGELPSEADGRVTMMACFQFNNNCCEYFKYIQVTNCGEYYVYYLNGTPDSKCYLRYCGSD